jgi:hypothetical protein
MRQWFPQGRPADTVRVLYPEQGEAALSDVCVVQRSKWSWVK